MKNWILKDNFDCIDNCSPGQYWPYALLVAFFSNLKHIHNFRFMTLSGNKQALRRLCRNCLDFEPFLIGIYATNEFKSQLFLANTMRWFLGVGWKIADSLCSNPDNIQQQGLILWSLICVLMPISFYLLDLTFLRLAT